MSRAQHSRHAKPGSVPVVAETADRATTVPTTPSTEPLPSDQLSAPREPATATVGETPIVPEPVAETAPLPAPVASDEIVDGRATSLAHVDGTVPLPSDQITPLVHVDQPIRSDADDRVSLRLSVDAAAAGEAIRDLRHEIDRLQTEASLPAGSKLGFLVGIKVDTAKALRRELEAAGYGVVILSASTVDMLRADFGLSAIGSSEVEPDGRSVDEMERRRFRVMQDVSIDGRDVAPGAYVRVTRNQFDRLHQSGTVRTAFWSQGLQDGEDDQVPLDDEAEDD